MMDKGGASRRHIAAVLALVMASAQANVVFPMGAIGLQAGFMIHPLDVAGVAILLSVGPRVASVLRPALYGAIVAIALRALAHFLLM
jgi:hypothetical protein